MGPTGSGSSSGCLSTRPFTVSLYMSLRTLLISERQKYVKCGKQLNKNRAVTLKKNGARYITVILILTYGEKPNVAYKSLPCVMFVFYR